MTVSAKTRSSTMAEFDGPKLLLLCHPPERSNITLRPGGWAGMAARARARRSSAWESPALPTNQDC